MNKIIVATSSFIIVFIALIYLDPQGKLKEIEEPFVPAIVNYIEPEIETPELTTKEINKYISYSEIVKLMKQWSEEAPRLCEFGTYGKTSRGTDCSYLRMGKVGKPKLLIHACLHGNEKLSTAATINIMGRLLSNYKLDNKATWILENRDVYFVPVLSPDSYPHSRHVEGKDPNRNYPSPENPSINSVSPVKRIRELFTSNKFVGVISGHTYGRIYFYPRLGGREQSIKMAKEMGELSNYRAGAVGSGYPIRNPNSRGYEIDYYHSNGAIAVLTEFGTSHNMSERSIISETDRTYDAYLLFMKKAPDYQKDLNPQIYQKQKQTFRRVGE